MNQVMGLEFELTHFKAEVLYFSHNAMRIHPVGSRSAIIYI